MLTFVPIEEIEKIEENLKALVERIVEEKLAERGL
jgi:hypothetical protein